MHIRDIEEGIYYVSINDESDKVLTLYYKVIAQDADIYDVYDALLENGILTLTKPLDNDWGTIEIPVGKTLDIGTRLLQKAVVETNGNVVKSNDLSIVESTYDRLSFGESGELIIGDGEKVKVQKENDNNTVSQCYIVVRKDPGNKLTLVFVLESDDAYNGRTITKDFDCSNIETEGTVTASFTVNDIPSGVALKLSETKRGKMYETVCKTKACKD